MENGRFTLHRRALMVLDQLPASDRGEVLARLAQIGDLPHAQWPSQGIPRLASDQPLYLLRVNDSLRAILRAADGTQPEVLDVVRHETLEAFARAGA